MLIFTWIVLGLAGLLMTASALCWGVYLAAESADWRKLAVKVFRISMVFLLFYVNVYIYAHIFGVATGRAKPVPEIIEGEGEAPQSLRSCPREAGPGRGPVCSAFLA